jgi:hypothetical protein
MYLNGAPYNRAELPLRIPNRGERNLRPCSAFCSAKNAGVHYYLVREREIGQKTLPPAEERPIIEGRLTFDLKPKGRIGARERFVINQPGAYLLRVETLRTQREHEHFSAIDVQIQ